MRGGPLNRAVIVGIDSYPGAPLFGCVNDAKDVADCLSLEQYDFDSKLLLNGQATRSSILRNLHELAYGEEEGGTLVFYFAGHGQVLGQAGHLVTHDAERFDPGISLSQLAQIMESASRNFDHVVTILDCCHSGSAYSWSNSRPLQAGDIEREVPTVNESRCILAACRPEESAEERRGHGVFTDALTSALLGDAVNWNGEVTLLGVFEHISASLSTELQTPVFKGDIAGTVVLGSGFDRREGPPIDKSELAQNLAKAHHLVDQYHYLQLTELSERNVRLQQGARKCSIKLEPVVHWFEETEKALPDLKRHADWTNLVARVREFRKNLADISVGELTRFGRVVRHLGHGGYGHVWELEDDGGARYAMKIFHGNELDDEVKVRRFANGYNNMRKLEHPYIVRVHEMLAAPYGFLMDSIAGDNLRKAYIDRNDPESVLQLMIDICETVQHAHSQQVRHRDIKPENIIAAYSDRGRLVPYLTDFDLAYHETNRTVTTNIGVGGVINYAAPEQLFEPNARTARSETVDVFSLAQLMFFVITGRDPSGENFAKNLEILTHDLGSWVDDRAAKTLIELYRSSTSKQPSERPQTVVDFVSELRHAESVIQVASGTDKIMEEDFCRRVGQLYAGLNNYSATEGECRMNSRSGQVEIVVRFKNVSSKGEASLELECSVTDKLPVPSLKSGRSARESINIRLDKIVARLPGVRRHAGNKGAYQVYLSVDDVTLDVAGVAWVADVIAKAVAGIEQW
ncbi:caspase family protein [Streptomyces sp. Ag109_O5-10]|uniref:protein kinase domain-containing protein n=1 Tax=Streptomyces sp. Ag109_O5-10 TaxID=1855349 RepID=UPI000898D99D|nr:caspase family protein [Streptomyces sp. Ag109_O5-10]SEE89150.1 Serine/threonine protein kinase [Streptomyces sp. Ag109_O5-10]